MTRIVAAGRLRHSPFHESVLAEGAESFLPYHRMLIPRGFGNREEEYWRLINGVSMWDVAAQRQVQLRGPDAARLAQTLCARDLSGQRIGEGRYVAICDHRGVLLSDAIAQKLADDHFWLSVSDSDIWTWARCVAGERSLEVDVSEPDASPLAVQGPKAEEVVVRLLGDAVRDLKYFWFEDATLEGIPLKVARSGWSKQGGFELYLLDADKGKALWSLVRQAGERWDIGPGYPNPSERTESGLLNWDVDTDARTNPFEVRMERFVDLDVPDDVIGIRALRELKARGIRRHQLGVALDIDYEEEDQSIRLVVEKDGQAVGHMTHKAWSYRLKRMIGYVLVSTEVCAGETIQVVAGRRRLDGELVTLPFIR